MVFLYLKPTQPTQLGQNVMDAGQMRGPVFSKPTQPDKCMPSRG